MGPVLLKYSFQWCLRGTFQQSEILILISKAVETAILNHRYSEDCYDRHISTNFESLYREKEKY